MKVKLTVDSKLGLAGKIVDMKSLAECRIACIDGLAKELPPEPDKAPAAAPKAAKKATKKAKKG